MVRLKNIDFLYLDSCHWHATSIVAVIFHACSMLDLNCWFLTNCISHQLLQAQKSAMTVLPYACFIADIKIWSQAHPACSLINVSRNLHKSLMHAFPLIRLQKRHHPKHSLCCNCSLVTIVHSHVTIATQQALCKGVFFVKLWNFPNRDKDLRAFTSWDTVLLW